MPISRLEPGQSQSSQREMHTQGCQGSSEERSWAADLGKWRVGGAWGEQLKSVACRDQFEVGRGEAGGSLHHAEGRDTAGES